MEAGYAWFCFITDIKVRLLYWNYLSDYLLIIWSVSYFRYMQCLLHYRSTGGSIMPFESPDENLNEPLKRIATGKLQLPDFQREWLWDDDRIKSLLASVSQGYPVGVVMTLEVGEKAVSFAPKPLAGVDAGQVSPDELLLDGQQRLTSLYQALAS